MPFRLLRYLAVIPAMLVTACAGLLGPRDLVIPVDRLQNSLARRFPLVQHPLDLIDMRLTNPQLALQPDSNRMSLHLDAALAPAFTQRTWRGGFTLSGVLELDPARHAVVLTQPRIEQLAFDGLDAAIAEALARAAGILASQILRDTPLYTFGADEFRYGGSQFTPTHIVTTASGLKVTFEPRN
ncbi:MAG: DUF1439 domain-containing protein [Pseudomonadota bacterium]|nr:DUF1439 domain-containing protein [Pseudomonadota bacterium]